MPVDPGIAALLELIAAAGYPPMSQGTPEVARKAFRAMTVDTVTDETRIEVGSVEDREVAGVPCRLYRPAGEDAVATFVYLHGGGFVIGDLDTHDQTCRRLCADAGVVVLAVDYRLAPEHPFPAAVEDALAVTDWAAEHLDELGGNEQLAIGGDSAGGNLAAVVAQAMPDDLDLQVLIYPAVHLLGDYPSRTENAEGYFLDLDTMLWFGAQYVGAEPDGDDARHSPLLGELDDVPPALVYTAEYDPLRDEGEEYAALLEKVGALITARRYDGLIHGFIDMGVMSPAADAALAEIVADVRAALRVS